MWPAFEAVLSVGAVPVLVDVDDTLTLNPDAVRKAITPKTKAVMPVHMCGSMADMDALMAICKEHKLILIEDACQSIGATYKGKSLGTIGDAGTFSFDFVKTMTCAEGGVVMTNNEDVLLSLMDTLIMVMIIKEQTVVPICIRLLVTTIAFLNYMLLLVWHK